MTEGEGRVAMGEGDSERIPRYEYFSYLKDPAFSHEKASGQCGYTVQKAGAQAERLIRLAVSGEVL